MSSPTRYEGDDELEEEEEEKEEEEDRGRAYSYGTDSEEEAEDLDQPFVRRRSLSFDASSGDEEDLEDSDAYPFEGGRYGNDDESLRGSPARARNSGYERNSRPFGEGRHDDAALGAGENRTPPRYDSDASRFANPRRHYLSTCSPTLAGRLGLSDPPLDARELLEHALSVFPVEVKVGTTYLPVEVQEDKRAIFERLYGPPTVNGLCDILSRYYKDRPDQLGIDLTEALPPEIGELILSKSRSAAPPSPGRRRFGRYYLATPAVSRRWAELTRNAPFDRESLVPGSPGFETEVLHKMYEYLAKILRYLPGSEFDLGTPQRNIFVRFEEGGRNWELRHDSDEWRKYGLHDVVDELTEYTLKEGAPDIAIKNRTKDRIGNYKGLRQFMPPRAIGAMFVRSTSPVQPAAFDIERLNEKLKRNEVKLANPKKWLEIFTNNPDMLLEKP